MAAGVEKRLRSPTVFFAWRAEKDENTPGVPYERFNSAKKEKRFRPLYSSRSIRLIAAAAFFAEPIASITVAAPVAMSPPAKTW